MGDQAHLTDVMGSSEGMSRVKTFALTAVEFYKDVIDDVEFSDEDELRVQAV